MSLYLEHFGLREPPFRITPHTDFFFTGANRGPTLDALIYAISQGEGIVKVNDSRSRNAPTIVEQTRARHILVRVNEVTSESEAKAKIDRVRDRIEQGGSFADQAKVNSEDASSGKGGDLGWISPGDTVPEFEQAMAKLKVGELSGPVRSPFGWHLILVEERRTQDVTEARKRDQARQAIRARKADDQFGEFMRQVRDKAYVEYKIDDK